MSFINDKNYSVLMSIYKKTNLLEFKQCVNSMLEQTIAPEQFIIVCDGEVSTDVDKELDYYVSANPELFSIVRLQKNSGLAVALNSGLEVARNEMIARMDSDDISLPQRCEKQLECFLKDPELALLGTATADFINNPCDAKPSVCPYPETHDEIKKILRKNNPFAHSSIMFKKTAVLACGGYDPELRRRQDYDLFSKMVSRGYKAGNLQEHLVLFRANDDFVVRNKNKETCDARILVQKRILNRGECSLLDYLYVWFAMKVSQIVPVSVYRFIYDLVKKNTK